MKIHTPETLKAWRIKRGWTIPYAANYFRVGDRTWWRWENEKIPFPFLVSLAIHALDAITKKT